MSSKTVYHCDNAETYHSYGRGESEDPAKDGWFSGCWYSKEVHIGAFGSIAEGNGIDGRRDFCSLDCAINWLRKQLERTSPEVAAI